MIKKQFETTKDRVITILREVPEARESDKVLWIAYIYKYNNPKNLDREVIKDLLAESPSFETITRSRRKAQEENVALRGLNHQNKKARSFDVAKFLKEF